ncbi:ejaculatory bulb-specific protein 3-like [Topomyia yanbarensis]|uniref:ejaculatory bulb-specific protein 3-like n=1 Tax=Topomyia yanbarensis TaxID=2498891 RepID=UPI00273AF5F3|nr:ejaculatory bulb-specific protein 3-like [Topomyia yanbarensis]
MRMIAINLDDRGFTYIKLKDSCKKCSSILDLNPSKLLLSTLTTMKFIIIVLALVALVAAQDDKYTTKYDSIDVDEILKSDRLFSNYFKCLMDEGPCTPEGNELKRVLPDSLENDCSKCSEKQKESSTKVIKSLTETRPEQWKLLKAKYDPENKYVEKYASSADKDGIKL